jgi:hypothetical protein
MHVAAAHRTHPYLLLALLLLSGCARASVICIKCIHHGRAHSDVRPILRIQDRQHN